MNPFRLWVYLQTTPLFWLTATLAAFLAADALAKAAGRRPIVNHVLIAIALLGGLLKLTGTDYQTYFNGAQFVHFLLGPATVALGVPIFANFALVRRNAWPLAAALLVGAVVAIASAVLVAKGLGAPRAVLIALAPKSITAGVAMAVTEALGGAPPLTAVLVIATGILGAIIVTPLMNALGVTDYAARLRRRACVARHRHGARLCGRPCRRRVRRACDGTQRGRDACGDPGAPALADRLTESGDAGALIDVEMRRPSDQQTPRLR
jgi:putative effector of murein hydrolase